MRYILPISLILLIAACSLQSEIPSATLEASENNPAVTAGVSTDVPAEPAATHTPASTDTPANTATPVPTATPAAPPRWYWAVSGQKVFAFNTGGQVNEVLDLGGVPFQDNDQPPVRISDERAVLFLFNNDHPKAYVLTETSASEIKLPDVRALYMNNGWSLEAHSDPYLVFAAHGGSSMPAILIDAEKGESVLLARNVFSSTSIMFLPNGKTIRYAVGGDDGLKLHQRDLQSGEDEVIFETRSTSLGASLTGETWFEYWNNRGITSRGEPFSLPDMKDDILHILLPGDRGLSISKDCGSPCGLKLYPVLQPEQAATYLLPVELINYEVEVRSAYLIGQDALLVDVSGVDGNYTPKSWLLFPDGTNQLIGYSFEYNFGRQLVNHPQDHALILASTTYDPVSSYNLIDLNTGETLFTRTAADPFVELYYSAEGTIILELTKDKLEYWSMDLKGGPLMQANTSRNMEEVCRTLTPDGRLMCFTRGGAVVLYDLDSGGSSILIDAPVSQLSD